MGDVEDEVGEVSEVEGVCDSRKSKERGRREMEGKGLTIFGEKLAYPRGSTDRNTHFRFAKIVDVLL